jgi:hypothetical protein
MHKEDRDGAMKAIEGGKPAKEVSPLSLALFLIAATRH